MAHSTGPSRQPHLGLATVAALSLLMCVLADSAAGYRIDELRGLPMFFKRGARAAIPMLQDPWRPYPRQRRAATSRERRAYATFLQNVERCTRQLYVHEEDMRRAATSRERREYATFLQNVQRCTRQLYVHEEDMVRCLTKNLTK